MPADAELIAEDATVLRSDTLSSEVVIVLVRPSSSKAADANGTTDSLQHMKVEAALTHVLD